MLFLVLALSLPRVGLIAFAAATGAALGAQAVTMLEIPRDEHALEIR